MAVGERAAVGVGVAEDLAGAEQVGRVAQMAGLVDPDLGADRGRATQAYRADDEPVAVVREVDVELAVAAQVEVAVAVEVGEHGGVADGGVAGGGGDVGEGAVAVVAPELLAGVEVEVAVVVHVGEHAVAAAADAVAGHGGEDACAVVGHQAVAGGKDVQVAVVVEVAEGAVPRVPGPEAGRGRDVGEEAGAVVLENAAAAVADDMIEVAVIVDVGEVEAGGVASGGDAAGRGLVREVARAVVDVEAVRAVDREGEVVVAVAVDVGPGAAVDLVGVPDARRRADVGEGRAVVAIELRAADPVPADGHVDVAVEVVVAGDGAVAFLVGGEAEVPGREREVPGPVVQVRPGAVEAGRGRHAVEIAVAVDVRAGYAEPARAVGELGGLDVLEERLEPADVPDLGLGQRPVVDAHVVE